MCDLTFVINCFLNAFPFDDKIEMPVFVVIGTTAVFRGTQKGVSIGSERRVHSSQELQAESVPPRTSLLASRNTRKSANEHSR